ncbi:NDK [Hepatospora eriocheir]|uniref:Nucleoside diphosphate kinase n=1 Tax=Hepatospora eriocheir TaxID=1081669 RepID=A0A1X0Q9B8_9MICR|nr:NDK [Hepatospora eriocheir]
MVLEQTFIICKPEAVKRRLVGEIISRFERKGLYINNIKFFKPTKEQVENHYEEHRDKPFFDKIVKSVSSGFVCAFVLEGNNAVSVARTLIGETNPVKSCPGSIRGDFGLNTGKNLIHGADSVESAKREIKIFMGELNKIEYFDEDLIYE